MEPEDDKDIVPNAAANSIVGATSNRHIPVPLQGADVTNKTATGKVSWEKNKAGEERFNTRDALNKTLDKYLGGYTWNRVDRTPEARETERMARLTDMMNNQWRVQAPAQEFNVHRGSVVHTSPAMQGGIVQGPQWQNEDMRKQEMMRQLEAERQRWNSGLPTETTRFGNQAELLKNAQAAMNNLATQYDAGELQQTLINMGLEKDAIAQLMQGFNEIQLQARLWNSDYQQNQAKFASEVSINEALQRVAHILRNQHDYLALFVMMTAMGGGMGIPGLLQQWSGDWATDRRNKRGGIPLDFGAEQ